eukprot:TRINITY_DN8855_c0_g2_i1.p1 TRINITY_DN8855_c0_g2~~TRINITY_DN8855_c0_g2_i1.p1  ORF type:complete len:1963 (+),score=523.65 TRINITY_DN8855_c0_g2_i1:91-5979(+)
MSSAWNRTGGNKQPWQQNTEAQKRPQTVLPRTDIKSSGGSSSWTSGQVKVEQPNTGGVVPPRVQVTTNSIMVITRGGDGDEVVIRTLLGEYVESTTNHDRKVFKRKEATDDNVDVFLYYWDNRDGPAFEGWWFGNQLGGTQVWSHNPSSAMSPPQSGWKIPWDGSVRPTLAVVPKAEWVSEKAKDIIEPANQATMVARKALQQANQAVAAVGGENAQPSGQPKQFLVANLRAAQEQLDQAHPRLADAMKSLLETQAQHQRSGDAAPNQLVQLVNTLRSLQQSVNAELQKVRNVANRFDQTSMQQKVQEKDMLALEELLPECIRKANLAEDAVEKATITSEMIEGAGEDMEEVKDAVMQTDQAVVEAQKLVGEARIFVNSKQAIVRRFDSEAAKQQGFEQINGMQAQLQEAQTRLNPLKTVRQDFLVRANAKKLASEVLARLTPAEVDVDRAEEATMLLSSDTSKEAVPRAEEAAKKASDHLTSITTYIQHKKQKADKVSIAELEKLEERVNASKERLSELRNMHKDALERRTVLEMLEEAGEKVRLVQEGICKAADAEGPFLMGLDELPLQQTLAAVKACDSEATAANAHLSTARMFIATKMVEAKRMPPESGRDCQAKLKEYQVLLEEQMKKLNELKAATLKRKRQAMIREAEHYASEAEELAGKAREAASPLEEEGALENLSAVELRAAADATGKAEAAASQAISKAREFVTAKMVEAKGIRDNAAEISAALSRCQRRLETAQTEVDKWKHIPTSVEQTLARQRILQNSRTRLRTAEAKVARLEAQVDDLPEGKPADSKLESIVKGMEKEAMNSIRQVDSFLRSQARIPKEDLAKPAGELKALQERVEAALKKMREHADSLVIGGILKEVEEQVKSAEDAAEHTVKMEGEILHEEEQPADMVAKSIADLDSAVQAANVASQAAKTFLAMKRLAVKRVAESIREGVSTDLDEMQKRLDAVQTQISRTKKGMSGRKTAAVKAEVTAAVVAAQGKVTATVQATEAFIAAGLDSSQTACEKATKCYQDAVTSVSNARAMLLARQRESKGSSSDPALQVELSKALEKVSKIQAELEAQQRIAKEAELKFFAERIQKSAVDVIDSLEKQLASVEKAAAPVVDEKADFAATVFVKHVVNALREFMSKDSLTVNELFAKIAGGESSLSEKKFLAFMDALPGSDTSFSSELLQRAYKCLGRATAGVVSEEAFCKLFIQQFRVTTGVAMTDTLAVKTSKTLRKLEREELVDALEAPCKDPGAALMRVRIRAHKDGVEGYVSVAGNQGTRYLEEHISEEGAQKQLDKLLQELEDSCKDASKKLDQKIDELRGGQGRSAMITKAEMMKLKGRVGKVQKAQGLLLKKIFDAFKDQADCMEAESRRMQELAEKRGSAAVVEEFTSFVEAANSDTEKAISNVDAVLQTLNDGQDEPLIAVGEAEAALEAVIQSLEQANGKMKAKQDEFKMTAKVHLSEVRSVINKLRVRVSSLETKCKKQMVALTEARKKVEGDAYEAVAAVLRGISKANNLTTEALFNQLSVGREEISVESLKTFLSASSDSTLKDSQVNLGLNRFSSCGVSRLALSAMRQDFLKCVKDIAITDSLDVKDSKTIRKVSVGEIIEVLDSGIKDEATGLVRVHGRAMIDKMEGWISMRGNQGTPFLEVALKPYYCLLEATPFEKEFASKSAKIRDLLPGEVLEVAEGPRQEPQVEIKRIRGRARKDDKVGWVSESDAQGVFMEPVKLLVCKQSIALTTAFDISVGKAVRKLEVGEFLEALEDESIDEGRKIVRVKARTLQDKSEGWVTVRGNHGTSYMEASEKLMVCRRRVALDPRLNSTGSTPTRFIEVGELFESTDAPKSETRSGALRVRGRTTCDEEGWFSLTTKTAQTWSSRYRCEKSTAMSHDMSSSATSKAFRKIEVGEIVEAIALPVLEKSTSIIRVRCRAEKDGATGCAIVRGDHGVEILQQLPQGSK